VTGTVRTTGVDRTGWIFQNPHGVPDRTALNHVVLPLPARGTDRREAEERVVTVMADFHLAGVARQPLRELSGGEAQRLLPARASCSAPDLLLVDEPTAELDLRTARTVNASLGRVADRDAIVVVVVVVVTHDPDIRKACTTVVDLGITHEGVLDPVRGVAESDHGHDPCRVVRPDPGHGVRNPGGGRCP